MLDYCPEHLDERELRSVDEAFPYRGRPTVTWVNVDGLHEPGLLGQLGAHFGVHPLHLEDILNTNQRPKVEITEDTVFLVLKMLSYAGGELDVEQVSVVLGKDFVLSFQEKPGDVFSPIRQRLRQAHAPIRKAGADYLAYALVDAVVDHYFTVLEGLGEYVEELEEALLEDPSHRAIEDIQRLKRQLILVRRAVWPLREVISTLERRESPLIRESTGVYLRDVYDHTVQAIDTVENFREMIVGMLDIYLSSATRRLNEVMKVLTIIATIFIPLTFITGIYGMNFNPEAGPLNMPELNWPYGYPAALGVMATAALGMLYYFRRRKWL